MDPNQMPQAPFSPQPMPAPQPVPATPYQAPSAQQPTQTAMPQSAAIDEMTTPQADKNTNEAAAAVTSAISPQVSTSEAPIMPEPTPAAPESAPTVPEPTPTDATAQTPTPSNPAPQQAAPVQPAAAQSQATQTAPASTPPKSTAKKKILIPILAVACIALVFGAGFLIYSLLSNTGHKGEKALLAESIFVPKDQDNNAYALFSKDGKQLTEFIVDEYTNMIADHSKVRNKDGKYGVMGKDGKMAVEWQDGTIESYGGLYRVASEKAGIDLLITGNGKQIDLLKEDDELDGNDYSPIVVVYHDSKIVDVYTAYGDKLDEFTGSEKECETANSSIYMAVMCKGYIGIYNIYDLKKTASFTTDKQYDDFFADEAGDTFAFKGGSSWDKEDEIRSAVYVGQQFYELGSLCDYVYVSSQTANIDYPKGGYASCNKDGDSFLIGNDGKVTDVDVYKTAIYDATHYAKYDSENHKAEIYVNGKLVATAEATYTPANYNEYYMIQKDKGAVLYDLEGKEIYRIDANRAYLRGIDPYGNIAVMTVDDNYKIDSYLVNKDGKELTQKYDSVSTAGDFGYYVLTNVNSDRSEESKVTVVDKNGKTIIENASCGEVSYNKYAERFVCNPYYRDDDQTAKLFDKDGKELINAKGEFRAADTEYHFIIEDEDSTEKYYTASGELFYTVK